MNIDKYLNLLNLNKNYSLNELKKNYNNLILNYHKSNNKDDNYYSNLNNYYEILLNNLNINIENKVNNDMIIYNQYDDKLCINNKINNENSNENNSILIIDPINIEIEITFQEAYNGCSKPILISRIINNYNSINKEIETLYVNIPYGIDNKEIITINGKGNVYNNNYGDIKIIINLLNHKDFIRNGLDIIYNKTLTLKESLLGFEFKLIHINNKKYIINNKDILINSKKIIPNFGFKRDNFYGNLIIYFKTIFPKSLNSEQKIKLNELL